MNLTFHFQNIWSKIFNRLKNTSNPLKTFIPSWGNLNPLHIIFDVKMQFFSLHIGSISIGSVSANMKKSISVIYRISWFKRWNWKVYIGIGRYKKAYRSYTALKAQWINCLGVYHQCVYMPWYMQQFLKNHFYKIPHILLRPYAYRPNSISSIFYLTDFGHFSEMP